MLGIGPPNGVVVIVIDVIPPNPSVLVKVTQSVDI